MGGLREHIDRADLLDPVLFAAFLLKLEKTLEVTGESGRIAGYIYDPRWRKFQDLT